MWWLAAPLIVGAGKLIYDAVTDDSSSSSSSYSDIEEKERETKQQAKEKKNNKIRNEIEAYKKEQILQIKDKYKTVISLKSDKAKVHSKNKSIVYEIDDLKKESKEIEEAMKELEAIKNEILK